MVTWSGARFPQKALVYIIASALATGGALVVAPDAEARITRVQITATESPTFGGYSWPAVGQYEKIVGKAFGEVDPTDPKNTAIVDIGLAPRNARGNVEYSFDFYILKPINLTQGAHKMVYEPPNRGNKTWYVWGRVPSGNDPGSITDPAVLAASFLMPRGYTIVWSGWDKSAGTSAASFNARIAGSGGPGTPMVIAKNPDGSSITGPAYEYIVTSGTSFALSYPAAALDTTQATLTHRVHLNDKPDVIPSSGWTYDASGTTISLLPAGTPFVANDIYELSYKAKDPTVNGLGFAAVRDWNAWLRYETVDELSTPPTSNPLVGDIKQIYTAVFSQPGRLLNDFRYLGFNQAENGKKVFDGMLQWVAGGDGLNMNYRFSQPNRTERNRQEHLFVEGVFPFANVMTTDPITGKSDSRYAKCEGTGTCPLAVEIFSANEYWVKAGSLLHTTPDGTADLPDSPFTRTYLMSSMQHGTGSSASKGVCQQFLNPLDSGPVQRALFLALDEWSTKGTPPPASRVPRRSDGTLVPPLPQSGMGFPNIPGVTYTGLKTTRYRLDYGSNFYQTGIAAINPPVITPPYEDTPVNGPIYPSFVPKTDIDGNDMAGVRLPDVVVPLATYTGWGLRAGAWANDGCEAAGQYIPFAKTKAVRVASGDPRASIEERYPSFGQYYSGVIGALDGLVKDRLLLSEDAGNEQLRLLKAGLNAGVPTPDLPAGVTIARLADDPTRLTRLLGQLPLTPATSQQASVLAVAGNVGGANGTYFRSDVSLLNWKSASQDVLVAWLEQGKDGTNALSFRVTFPPTTIDQTTGLIAVPPTISDFVGRLGITGIGSLLFIGIDANGNVDPGASIDTFSRIWTQQPGSQGTISQSLPSNGFSGLGATAQVTAGLRHDPSFRTNVGVVNLDSQANDFTVGARGERRSTTFTIRVPPFSMIQVPLPAGDFGNVTAGFVSQRSAVRWVGYGSSLDQTTQGGWISPATAAP